MPVPVPAGAPVVTSDEVFELEAAPRRAVVIGGGAVGLELAQWLARVGSRVTLASRSPLLHREDPELGLELTRALADEMEVCVPSRLVGLEPAAGGAVGVRLACAEGAETVHEADLVLNATGREPALEGLGVEEAFGLDPLDLRVGLHPTLQTKLPHVFLAGDASSRREILHEANIEGELAGRNAARVAGVAPGSPEPYDDALPTLTVIFTDPVFATVGLTPGDCEAAGVPYEAALKRLPEQGRGIVHGLRYGGVRVLADPRSGALIGCQVLSDRADDLIHIPATAIAFGATVEALWRRVPWYHPTQAEAFIEVFRELSQRLGRS